MEVQITLNKTSMGSKQYPYIVNVLRKRVNLIRDTRQPSSGEEVNLFRMDGILLSVMSVAALQRCSSISSNIRSYNYSIFIFIYI